MFLNHGFDAVTVVVNIKMTIIPSVALLPPLPTLPGRPGETLREADLKLTSSRQAQGGWAVLDAGFPPVAFTVMGKVRQELHSWTTKKVPPAVPGALRL